MKTRTLIIMILTLLSNIFIIFKIKKVFPKNMFLISSDLQASFVIESYSIKVTIPLPPRVWMHVMLKTWMKIIKVSFISHMHNNAVCMSSTLSGAGCMVDCFTDYTASPTLARIAFGVSGFLNEKSNIFTIISTLVFHYVWWTDFLCKKN